MYGADLLEQFKVTNRTESDILSSFVY